MQTPKTKISSGKFTPIKCDVVFLYQQANKSLMQAFEAAQILNELNSQTARDDRKLPSGWSEVIKIALTTHLIVEYGKPFKFVTLRSGDRIKPLDIMSEPLNKNTYPLLCFKIQPEFERLHFLLINLRDKCIVHFDENHDANVEGKTTKNGMVVEDIHKLELSPKDISSCIALCHCLINQIEPYRQAALNNRSVQGCP